MAIKRAKKVRLECGLEISKEFYDKLMSITKQRPRRVIEKIIKDGSCTTDELIEMGYKHGPRAKRDVVEQGIPIKKEMVTSTRTGRKIAKYTFGDWEEYKKKNSLLKSYGRNEISDRLKQKLIAENGTKCAIYNEEFPETLLQVDHRVPFEVGGDPEDMMDTSKFMLLSPSANRAKSWACEHCNNWIKKIVSICQKCYYASPEDYTHVAEKEERRLDIIFRDKEIETYNRLADYCKGKMQTMQNMVKRVLRYVMLIKEQAIKV